jgi:hypothetical protein
MNKWIKIGSILAMLVLATSALYFYSRNANLNSDVYAESSQEISLTKPAFLAGGEAATYLEQEAGMAYYVNTTGPLNLNIIKSLMDVENATSDYVIGSLKPPLNPPYFTSDDYPHCFVHKDGWIIVYYLRPTTQNNAWLGKIIDWSSRNSPYSDPITSNLLYDGLSYVANPLSISITNAKYYHFQYPTATKLLFAIKHTTAGQTATFNIKIPDTFTIHERSWSCFSNVDWGGHTFQIDTTQIARGSSRQYGGTEITEVILGPNVFHTVSISADNWGGNVAYVCLILLYS